MTAQHCDSENAPVVNALLDTLSHPIRREIIHYFEATARGDAATLIELVTHLNDRMPSEPDDQLRIKLRHTHLPKLEWGEWLEYDPDTDQIRYHGHDSAQQLLREVQTIF